MPADCANLGLTAIVLLAVSTLLAAAPASATDIKVDPGKFPAVGKVDKRFQSYNVEMVEVIGGRFWAPYPKPGDNAAKADSQKSGGVDVAGASFASRST